MCGICGFAASDPTQIPASPSQLRAMTDALWHRGPDDRGELLEPGVALGYRAAHRAVATARNDLRSSSGVRSNAGSALTLQSSINHSPHSTRTDERGPVTSI